MDYVLDTYKPSYIYSWFISHILEHELFCLGCNTRLNPECNTERGFIDSLYVYSIGPISLHFKNYKMSLKPGHLYAIAILILQIKN